MNLEIRYNDLYLRSEMTYVLIKRIHRKHSPWHGFVFCSKDLLFIWISSGRSFCIPSLFSCFFEQISYTEKLRALATITQEVRHGRVSGGFQNIIACLKTTPPSPSLGLSKTELIETNTGRFLCLKIIAESPIIRLVAQLYLERMVINILYYCVFVSLAVLCW